MVTVMRLGGLAPPVSPEIRVTFHCVDRPAGAIADAFWSAAPRASSKLPFSEIPEKLLTLVTTTGLVWGCAYNKAVTRPSVVRVMRTRAANPWRGRWRNMLRLLERLDMDVICVSRLGGRVYSITTSP